jgi:hypothetical protein
MFCADRRMASPGSRGAAPYEGNGVDNTVPVMIGNEIRLEMTSLRRRGCDDEGFSGDVSRPLTQQISLKASKSSKIENQWQQVSYFFIVLENVLCHLRPNKTLTVK